MIRVAQWGTGAMGQGLLDFVLDRPEELELVGAVVTNPAKVGVTVGELLDRNCPVVMTDDPDKVLATRPDVMLIATQSNLHEITSQVEPSLRAGCNVLSIAEKLTYPWASDAQWADRMNSLALENGVSLLGTGVNPGFVLDALIIMWTSACLRVDRVQASRVNDLSPFGPTVMRSQGVGTTPEEFARGLADGTIVGHIGFPESINLIARAVGWNIDRIEETREPIISRVERSTPHIHVAAGNVAGCRHTGRGYAEGELKIELVHPQQIHPHLEGQGTGDYIHIAGVPSINMQNTPELPGGIGTIASTGNYIPLVVGARPGLLTILDVPLPRALLPHTART